MKVFIIKPNFVCLHFIKLLWVYVCTTINTLLINTCKIGLLVMDTRRQFYSHNSVKFLGLFYLRLNETRPSTSSVI